MSLFRRKATTVTHYEATVEINDNETVTVTADSEAELLARLDAELGVAEAEAADEELTGWA